MFNPRLFENSRPDGFPVLEITETHEEGTPRPDGPPRFVPLRRSELIGEIVGPVAALKLTQRFAFETAPTSGPIEALYRFPLPGDAAVTGVSVRFGEVQIQAELQERTAGEAAYREAREEGRQAALLTRESPDVFTLQIAGLKAGEDVAVETSYAQLARPEGEGWTLRVPLTTAPRFVRSDERGSRCAAGQPLALLRDPGHRFALDLTVEGSGEIISPTHALDVDASEGRLRVRLRDGEVVPDRDCVLTWQPRRDAARPTLQILRHDDPADRSACFLALVAPPAEPSTGETLPREVILLIDHSGSMSGPKWEAADWAVQNLLAGLSPADTFNLGLFHDTTRWFAGSPVRGDERILRQAREFLLQHKDSGGTELGVALEQALGQDRDRDGRARHVLIVTDAQVSDAGRLLDLVERESSRDDRRRVDVLCIDAAPNSGLAGELAERGGGLAHFLTSDPAENDIATALDDVLADWAAPVLRGLALQIDQSDVQATGRRVSASGSGTCGIDLGDLPAGRAIWVAGRIERPGREVTFRLGSGDGREVATERQEPGAEPASRPAVAALFGARRVLELELASSSAVGLEQRLRQLGYDPDAVLKGAGERPIYAENQRAQATDAVRDLLVREALRYGIACSETAFVATRSEAGEKVDGTVAVANALPHGWSSDFLMPRMAAGGPAMLAASMQSFAPAPMPMAPPPGMLPPTGAGGRPDLGSLAHDTLDAARGLLRRRPPKRLAGFAGSPPTSPAPAESASRGASSDLPVLFSGVPAFAEAGAGREAVLFDLASASASLPEGGTLSRLAVRFPDGAPAGPLDPGLTLLLYVDDLASPRARVRLADLLRQGGGRPLNVRRQPGQVVRIVLQDANGAWAGGAPRLEVSLG